MFPTTRTYLILLAYLLSYHHVSYAQQTTELNPDEKWRLWTAGKTLLRGANIYQQEAYGRPWCSKAKSDDFKALREAGANYVNLSVPGIFNVDPPYKLNLPFFKELNRLVGFSKKHKLKVVISFRTAPGRGEGDITESGNLRRNLFFDDKAQDQFIAMWEFLAENMRNQSHIVGYDLLTEPTWKEHDAIDEKPFRKQWRQLAKRTITAIRLLDAKTPILIQPDGWASPEALEDWEPLYATDIEKHKKIVYAVHQYHPYEYTHSKDPFDPNMKELKNVFQHLHAFRQNYGVPLTINEFGIKFQRPQADKFIEKELELLEQYGMNHAIWIWEPADASCSGQHFDINIPQSRPILDMVRRNWKKNP